MSDLTLYKKIVDLSKPLKREVLAFMNYLIESKYNKNKSHTNHHPKAGCMKGTFKMHADFDEPLDDFKEYME